MVLCPSKFDTVAFMNVSIIGSKGVRPGHRALEMDRQPLT